MDGKYLLRFLRRMERQLVERIESLRQIRGRIDVATEQVLQRVFSNEGSLIPVPVRMVLDRRRLDQRRSRD